MFSTLSIPNWPVNRIISIAIRKTIGKYFILEDSPLSPSLAGLESDLSNGRVVLSGLVLDPSVCCLCRHKWSCYVDFSA